MFLQDRRKFVFSRLHLLAHIFLLIIFYTVQVTLTVTFWEKKYIVYIIIIFICAVKPPKATGNSILLSAPLVHKASDSLGAVLIYELVGSTLTKRSLMPLGRFHPRPHLCLYPEPNKKGGLKPPFLEQRKSNTSAHTGVRTCQPHDFSPQERP